MTLTPRQQALLRQLLTAAGVTTVATLAAGAHVSVRTLRYDLTALREWLVDQPASLKSQPHKGVWLEATASARAALRAALDAPSVSDALAPSARMVTLIFMLAQAAEFQTLTLLQAKVQVSPTTLKHDMKKLRAYLANTGVQLVSKNYYGYALAGAERDIRQLLVQLLHEGLNRQSLPANIAQALAAKQLPPGELTLTRDATINHLFTTVIGFAVTLAQAGVAIPELNTVLSTSIRLVVSVMRQSLNRPQNSYQTLSVEAVPETFAALLMQRVVQYYALPLLRDDYQYVAGTAQPGLTDQNLVAVTRAIILGVGQEVATDFASDAQLQENLYLHLRQQAAVAQPVLAYSPFTQDLQDQHPQLFGAIRRVLSRELPTLSLTDAFVSYVALHFLVSLHRAGHRQRPVRIAYICATGLGITNLIEARLAANISHIELVGFAGLEEAQALITRAQPDLVVSIFPLADVGVPVIEVQPLPTPADIERIREAVAHRVALPVGELRPATATPGATIAQQAQKAILVMFAIYDDLKRVLPIPVAPEYADAFLMHVFLAVHRVMFNQQSTAETKPVVPADIQHRIQAVFHRHGLSINQAEVHAITEYLKLSQSSQGGDADDRHEISSSH